MRRMAFTSIWQGLWSQRRDASSFFIDHEILQLQITLSSFSDNI
jgi:hypothetical protein